MARGAITPTQIVKEGVAQPAQTVGIADGHKFGNNGRVFVECTNEHTDPLDFTFFTSKKVAGLDLEDQVVTVDASDTKPAGPFPTDVFNQGDDEVYVDYDATQYANQKVRVYRL